MRADATTCYRHGPPAADEDRCGTRDDHPVKAPFFIVGCPRSGTTLMAVLMDRHPGITVPPETHFLIFEQRLSRVAGQGHGAMLEAYWREWRVADLELDREDVGRRFASRPCSARSLFESVMEAWASKARKPRWGEKTPIHLAKLGLAFEWFPNAKAIVVLRDGRDVVESMRRMSWGRNPWDHAAEWRRAVRAGEAALRRWPHRVILTRYEDLLSEPEVQLRRLMQFLGEDFDPRQLDAAAPSAVVKDRERAWKGRADQALDPSRASAWHRSLSGDALVEANARLGPELRRTGYPETVVAGGLLRRTRWTLRRVTWMLWTDLRAQKARRVCQRLLKRPGRSAKTA